MSEIDRTPAIMADVKELRADFVRLGDDIRSTTATALHRVSEQTLTVYRTLEERASRKDVDDRAFQAEVRAFIAADRAWKEAFARRLRDEQARRVELERDRATTDEELPVAVLGLRPALWRPVVFAVVISALMSTLVACGAYSVARVHSAVGADNGGSK